MVAHAQVAPEPDERGAVVGVTEIESAAVIEAGLLMPAPGEEAAWLQAHGGRFA